MPFLTKVTFQNETWPDSLVACTALFILSCACIALPKSSKFLPRLGISNFPRPWTLAEGGSIFQAFVRLQCSRPTPAGTAGHWHHVHSRLRVRIQQHRRPVALHHTATTATVARPGCPRPRTLPAGRKTAQGSGQVQRHNPGIRSVQSCSIAWPRIPVPARTALYVWAEHAPPPLDAEAVSKLIEKFKQNYPSEHLDSDTHPTITLLSLVQQGFRAHGTIKRVPWQLRMSAKTYQELIDARTARTLKTEAQLISDALFDKTPPEVSIAPGGINPAWLMRTQVVFSNAVVICAGAHLRMLHASDKRIFDLATQSLAPDSGLREVHTQELLQADRNSEGWSLDEALHELTKVRSDFHALLQPRAKAAAPQGKGGKGKGKDKGKIKGAIPTVTKTPITTLRRQPQCKTLPPSAATRRYACATTASSAPTSRASMRTCVPSNSQMDRFADKSTQPSRTSSGIARAYRNAKPTKSPSYQSDGWPLQHSRLAKQPQRSTSIAYTALRHTQPYSSFTSCNNSHGCPQRHCKALPGSFCWQTAH